MGYKVGWFVLRFLGVANVGKQFHWGLNLADVKSANLAGINIPVDTPFKDIYSAQNANEDHVYITPGAVTFIKNKLSASNCN